MPNPLLGDTNATSVRAAVGRFAALSGTVARAAPRRMAAATVRDPVGMPDLDPPYCLIDADGTTRYATGGCRGSACWPMCGAARGTRR